MKKGPISLHGPQVIAVEPAACPTLTRGTYAYDFGDTAGMAPALKMHTLGHGFMPAGIHAGGLRFHGVSPLVSILLDQGYIEARAVKQLAVFEAATLFAKTEGILPAPEAAHAIRTAVDLALEAKEKGEEQRNGRGKRAFGASVSAPSIQTSVGTPPHRKTDSVIVAAGVRCLRGGGY